MHWEKEILIREKRKRYVVVFWIWCVMKCSDEICDRGYEAGFLFGRISYVKKRFGGIRLTSNWLTGQKVDRHLVDSYLVDRHSVDWINRGQNIMLTAQNVDKIKFMLICALLSQIVLDNNVRLNPLKYCNMLPSSLYCWYLVTMLLTLLSFVICLLVLFWRTALCPACSWIIAASTSACSLLISSSKVNIDALCLFSILLNLLCQPSSALLVRDSFCSVLWYAFHSPGGYLGGTARLRPLAALPRMYVTSRYSQNVSSFCRVSSSSSNG